MAPSRSPIPFCLLGSLTREGDLVCASEGLVTIVTLSSGETGNRGRDRGRKEQHFDFVSTDFFLIAAAESGHAQQGIEYTDTQSWQGIVFHLN